MNPPQKVDFEDLQGNVLCGYGNDFNHGLYLFVRVDEGGAGRDLLGELEPAITNAVPWPKEPKQHAKPQVKKPLETLNVALSWRGLQALGVPAQVLETFSPEFQEGMEARAAQLEDTGRSAPEHWDRGLRAGEPHLLITVSARSQELLIARWASLRDRIAQAGPALVPVHEVRAELLEHPGDPDFAREHFGFADGISQPSIRTADSAGPYGWRGRGIPTKDGWRDVEPGEFVLGYLDEDGVLPDAPSPPLGKSGSYTVVRKLHQNVAAFTNFLRESAGGDREHAEWLAARIVGRERDGTPLSTLDRPKCDRRRDEWINDFRYAGDERGLECPLGAHVRRANPKDALGWEGELTKRHRIIRRAMPYGPRSADPTVDDGRERGLMFVCHQARIARQFELVQRWLMDGDSFRLGSDQDFLTGNERPKGRMTIQGAPPRFLHPQPAFVTTRGGEYFFTPGIGALQALAAGRWS